MRTYNIARQNFAVCQRRISQLTLGKSGALIGLALTRAFAALGGVPRLLVPDNAKVAVIEACLYEPQVNRTYAEMAAHYGTAVLPTRPHRPA